MAPGQPVPAPNQSPRETTSLHQAEHLISAMPCASHSLSRQIQVPSSTTLPVHQCPERTHYSGPVNVQTHSHVCTGTATQHTGMHTSEDFIYKFMAWNIVLSNSVSLKPNSGTVCVQQQGERQVVFHKDFLWKFFSCTNYVQNYGLLWDKKGGKLLSDTSLKKTKPTF